jgi:GntR family transcriptional regulator
VEIDQWSRVPRYQQLADILRVRIEAGEWAPGDLLPSENRLVQETGLAKNTVRQALGVLRESGHVVTIPTRGSFVNPDFRPGE